MERLDSEIKADIERRLEIDPYVREELIDVCVNDGEVVLGGIVGNFAEKKYAYYDSWVNGVISVDDTNVEVKWWMEEDLRRERKVVIKSDEDIKKAVEDVFSYDLRVPSYKINVEVENGIVTLTGVVDNLRSKRIAEKDAKNTLGVLTVENRLKVRREEPPVDSVISENVRDALKWDPVVERHDITVLTRNNKVFLFGNVDSRYEKMHAEAITSQVFGAVEVENNLEISEGWIWESDEEIKEDIKNELFWSIFVDSGDIQVIVDDGIVDLYGSVDTWGEVKNAVDNAYEDGAKKVRNHLKVNGIGIHPSKYSDNYR